MSGRAGIVGAVMSDPPLQKGPGVQDIMAFYFAEDAISRKPAAVFT
jgi:hypothetical protein